MTDEDDGFFILVLGVLAAIIAVVCWWFLSAQSIDTAVEVDSTEVLVVVDEQLPVDEDHEAEAVADPTAAASTGEIDNTTVVDVEVAAETGAVLIAVGAGAIDVDGTVPDRATADHILNYLVDGSLGRQVNDNLVIDEDIAAVAELELRGEAVNSAERFALSEGLAGLAAILGVGEPVDALTVAARPALENELNALVAAEPIEFDTGSATIRSESIPTLDQIVALLQPTGGVAPPPLEVQGHTDNIGDPIANVNLSLDRAVAVVDYLEQSGVNVDQISPVGFGANRPISSNANDEGRRQNRRIEFAFVG